MRLFIDLNRAHLRGDDYAALYDWSVESPQDFWAAIWRFCDVKAAAPYANVLRDASSMPGAKWFEGAKLNFAANLLEHEASGTALVFVNERGERTELSWHELRAQVASLAARLRALGLRRGDRVAAYIANRPEAVVAMLATASVGAVWSSCSPDFGVDAVLDRFGQIDPKVLFATDGYFYNGKSIDSLPIVRTVAARLKNLAAVVIVPYRTDDPSLSALPNAHLFDELLDQSAEPRYEPVAFDAPLYILYSSGTTGAPKCIVHGVGGTLLQHRKEHVLHTDIRAGDVVFYFTTCGWMMWNWLVSALASRATLLLYEGAPLHPDAGILWRLAERENARYLWHERQVFERAREIRLRAARAARSGQAPLDPLDGLATRAGRLRLRL